MITRELQVSNNEWLQRLDAAEYLIGERVPVKGVLPTLGRTIAGCGIQAKAASLPISRGAFKASGISSPFFFLFLNPNSQCYKRIFEVDAGSPFRIRLRPRDILSRGSPCPTRYHLNPRGMAAITRGIDK